ncbi:MAG: dihydrodipicolinate synthase family protein [Candidatus Marinimicrobia bacterium]|nr:dihydrodipicolinate synthase family protein [Candidatus Neomarinimicrobiota bacterium]MBL7009924.1 dihydrodipicolinate synthase family protein [Candidatus Neomarinimicrobiota bacterium]MBL7029777.1 dihydrodipicolinate synthase family protein [Candidatus Neomarinimicrobiota bacterium]
MNNLKGVWTPILTPLKADLTIDKTKYFNHLRWLLNHGIDGIVVFGTNGEATSFSVFERMELLDWIKEVQIPSDNIMVGTGCSALTDTITLGKHAVSNGYFHHLMLPPFYYKTPSQEGLVHYFSEVIQRIDDERLKIYLYNFPLLSGIHFDVNLVKELMEKFPDQIVGYKDSSGDWENTKVILTKCPGLTVFPGSEAFLTQVLDTGGAGVISGTANVNPGYIKETYNTFFTDRELAASCQEKITAFRKAVQAYPLIAALKGLMKYQRNDDKWGNLRPPLSALSSSDFKALLRSVKSLKYTLADSPHAD